MERLASMKAKVRVAGHGGMENPDSKKRPGAKFTITIPAANIAA